MGIKAKNLIEAVHQQHLQPQSTPDQERQTNPTGLTLI